MKVIIIRKFSFGDRGKEWFHFEDEKLQEAYTTLTGLKSITPNNLNALALFNVEFEIK